MSKPVNRLTLHPFRYHRPRFGKSEITQEQHYEAYGLRLGGLTYMGWEEERYAYSGKERIGELGLGWTDFGARMYNPTIGRWNGVDALPWQKNIPSVPIFMRTFVMAYCNAVRCKP